MTPQAPARKANPLTREVATAFGTLVVEARRGDEASFASRGLLTVEGGGVVAKGEVRKERGEWVLASFVARSATGGLTVVARLGAEGFAAFRDGVAASVTGMLDGEPRLLVEADLVDVFRERKRAEDAVASVRAEIKRRESKLEAMALEARRAEEGLSAREAAARAALSSMPRHLPSASRLALPTSDITDAEPPTSG